MVPRAARRRTLDTLQYPHQPPCEATSHGSIITYRMHLLCKHSFKIVSQVPFSSQLLTLNFPFIEILKLYLLHLILIFSGPQLCLPHLCISQSTKRKGLAPESPWKIPTELSYHKAQETLKIMSVTLPSFPTICVEKNGI